MICSHIIVHIAGEKPRKLKFCVLVYLNFKLKCDYYFTNTTAFYVLHFQQVYSDENIGFVIVNCT